MISPKILIQTKNIPSGLNIKLLGTNVGIVHDHSLIYAVTRFRYQWRVIGRVMNYPAFVKEVSSHPHVYLYDNWVLGRSYTLPTANM